MNYVEVQAMKEFVSTFSEDVRVMYKEQLEKAQRMFQHQEGYSSEELQEQANLLNDIKMRIEIGYEASKDMKEREAILNGIF